MSNEIVKIDPTNIQKNDIPQLKALMQNPNTRTQGEIIIKTACIQVALIHVRSHIDLKKEHREINEDLVKQNSNIINPQTGAINYEGVAELFRQEFSKYYNIERQRPNVLAMIKGFFDVPNKIKSIRTSNKIIEQCKYMRNKYYNNPDSEYYLPKKIEEGVNLLLEDAKEDKFYEKMKFLGPKEFITTAIVCKSDINSVFNHFDKDMDELNEIYGKRIKILKKRGEL